MVKTYSTSSSALPPAEAQYLAAVKKFPILSSEEEVALFKAWYERGDKVALRKLLSAHLRMVVGIAHGFRGYGLLFQELIAEGNLGLMMALRSFDTSLGNRFSTYARWWVRAAIHRLVLQSFSIVKIGTSARRRRIFFNLERMPARLDTRSEGELDPHQVAFLAAKLCAPEADVIDIHRRLRGRDVSLDMPRDDGEGLSLGEMLADERPNADILHEEAQLNSTRRSQLARAMKVLNERERDIFTARRLRDEPTTLEVLAQRYSVSRQRIRQIDLRAFEKVAASARQSPSFAN